MNSKKTNMKDRVVLITGAGRGIGRACALTFAEAGCDIALGLRDQENAPDLVEEIKSKGVRAFPVQMNISQMDEISAAVAEVVSYFGRINILVNNAGIGAPNPAVKVTEKDFDETINVNLKGTFFTSQAVGKQMIKQGTGGSIINMSSQAGFVALDTESVYCMTKAGISHLTKCLALEWAPYNIRVNAVAPTFIKTPGTVKWLKNEEFRKSVLQRIPLNRTGIPEDVADPVLFLASDEASMITGTTLMIDGGWTIQ